MFLPFGKLPHGQVNASCNLVTLAKECLWTQNHKVGFAPQCSPHIQDILWAHFLEVLSKTPMFLEVWPFHQNHSYEIMPEIFPQVPKARLKTVFLHKSKATFHACAKQCRCQNHSCKALPIPAKSPLGTLIGDSNFMKFVDIGFSIRTHGHQWQK